MSLKSSEINNCSWRISTVLESYSYFFFLLLPSILSTYCQTNEESVGTDSEDFHCSIFFSMHLLWMTKKIHYFLRYFTIGEKNISVVQYQSKSSSQWKLFLGKSRQVLFFVVLHWPLIGMQNLSHPVLTHILRAELLEFLSHCCSNSSQTYLIHEKFWPRSEYCLCSKTRFWSQLHSYRVRNWLQLSNTGPIFVFPWIHPFGCDASSSLGRVYSRQATAWNCERSAVSFVLKCCPISTTFRNPASIQNLLTLFSGESFSIGSPYCCNRRSWLTGSSQSKGTSVLITLSTSEELDCPITTGLSVLSWRDSCSSHISATAP